MLEPRIVIGMPLDCQNEVMVDVSSPIKNSCDSEKISKEFMTLFDGNLCQFQSHKKDDSIQRRLSMGEKIKGKLQSTNNRSPVIPNSKCTTSQFIFDKMSESKLYSQEIKNSRDEGEDENPMLVITKQVYDHQQYDESVITFGQNKKDLVGQKSKNEADECVVNTEALFPFHQLSAKTYHSSPDLQQIKRKASQNNNDNSPIRILKDISNSSVGFSNFNNNKIQKLSFNVEQVSPKIQISQVKTLYKQSQNRQKLCFGPEQQQIRDVDSFCIPNEHFESFEYAMLQLSKLRENVQVLENATKALEKLKPSSNSINFPSRISHKQCDDKNGQQFLEYFEQNLRQVLCKMDGENMIINTHSIQKQNILKENMLIKNKKSFQIKRLQFS